MGLRSYVTGLIGRSAATTVETIRKVTGFDIGRTGRRMAAIPSVTTAINSLIKQYGRAALARSRYLCQNNPYAASAKETFVSALVGSGIKPSTLSETAEVKKAMQELWYDWVDYADADGIQDHYGQQALVASELFEAGEVFAILEEDRSLLEEDMVPLRVRILQSEMLPFDYSVPATTSKLSDGNYIEMGIEFDRMGRRVAYHFLNAMPGDPASVYKNYGTTRYPAEQVLHVFRPIKAGQIRGIPHTLSGMVTLAMLDLYDDAELERKRTAALFAGFITKKADEDEEGDGENPLGELVSNQSYTERDVFGLEPGAMTELDEGEDVAFSEPADVGGNYEAFQYRNLLKAAAGFGVPYSSFTGDLKSVNYSSIRAGLVEFRRRIEAMQHNIVVFQFGRPIWNKFLDLASFNGLAPWTATDYRRNRRLHRRVKWLPPRWEWVDPLKDLQAEDLAVSRKYKARSDVIEGMGSDPEETDARIKADMERERALGLPSTDGTTTDPAPADPSVTPLESPTTEEDRLAQEQQDAADAGKTWDEWKQETDSYGVAVRAGAITPQPEDEQYFRSGFGLPVMRAEVSAAWQATNNVRTPITLVKPGQSTDSASAAADNTDNPDNPAPADNPEDGQTNDQ